MNQTQEIEMLLMMINDYKIQLRELDEKSKPRKKGCVGARKRAVLIEKLLRVTQQDLAEIAQRDN